MRDRNGAQKLLGSIFELAGMVGRKGMEGEGGEKFRGGL